ncbi:MAG: GNAT family N-acetyltransferase [Alphaproteobacteria bacterium]|nr:GNAT family N-acetyltransferase [Alphaproteobacteria bacterium]
MTNTSLSPQLISDIRASSRALVRELGFMQNTLAGTDLSPSAVHALIEIGITQERQARDLADLLLLEKSTVSRLLRKLVSARLVAEASHPFDGRSKTLTLTESGRSLLNRIDEFAIRQIHAALAPLGLEQRTTIQTGLRDYSAALRAGRDAKNMVSEPISTGISILAGYQPGLIGKTALMHATYYHHAFGFGQFFESRVAGDLVPFCARLDHPKSNFWTAQKDREILGTIAIDGEDLGPGIAHLRWFILDPSLRGKGIGQKLLRIAIDFCRETSQAEILLWTFKGLNAARKLYESQGFVLLEEVEGEQWGKKVLEQRFRLAL